MTGRGKLTMISDTIVRQRVRRPSRRKWYVRPWQRAYPGVEALVCPVLAQKLTHILEIPEETDNQEGSCLKSWLVHPGSFGVSPPCCHTLHVLGKPWGDG